MIWVRAAVQAVQLFLHCLHNNAKWDVQGIQEDFGFFKHIHVIAGAEDVQNTGKDFIQFLRLWHLLHQDWLCEVWNVFACHMIKYSICKDAKLIQLHNTKMIQWTHGDVGS